MNGLDVSVLAFLAGEEQGVAAGSASPGTATWDPAGSPGRIAAESAASDLLIVCLHLHLAVGWTEVTPPDQPSVYGYSVPRTRGWALPRRRSVECAASKAARSG